jgi:hypothetical protein
MAESDWQYKSLSQKILDRQARYEQIREPWNYRMSEIIEFCDPGLTAWEGDYGSGTVYYHAGQAVSGGSYDNGVEGRFRGTRSYEGTPPWGLRVMANGWQGSLISRVIQWFKYMFPEPRLRGNDDVNRWMQELEDFMYSVYRTSELYTSMGPFTRGGLSVGSSVIIPYEDEFGKLKCEVPHPKENYHGPHDSYHRKYKIPVLDAVKKFMGGKVDVNNIINAKLSYSLLRDYLDGKHDERHEFVRVIYRNDDPILNGQPIRFRNKPWMEFYVETPKSGQGDNKYNDNEPLSAEGYFTKPHIKWDYEKNTDEYYARTPSWHAMIDIKSLQEFERQKHEAGQRQLNPPMWIMRKYRNQYTGNPGNRVFYSGTAEADNIPRPILDGTDWQLGDLQARQIRQSVERWYQTNFFLQISTLTSENTGTWPTATQILQLSGEKALILAPQVGDFTDRLREIDDRFFDIQRRKGALPDPPQIVVDYFGEQEEQGNSQVNIDIEFIGSLASLQQRAETLGRSEEGLSIIGAYSQLDPMLTKKARLSVAMEKDLESIRWPQDAIVPEDEYQDILAAIAEAEAQDKMVEQGLSAAGAAKGVSGPVDESSILAGIGEQAA